ncbi:unnamed protein product [Phytophthora fragariaefolia]|uniref:Unnamed protein product n=1 Tax=Phytophthora fragariaefolia TaxID=1490495 RepID=A0A9W6TYV3_9STRA|nr:unnamed protein product [Phytophthora fragariaefolia]
MEPRSSGVFEELWEEEEADELKEEEVQEEEDAGVKTEPQTEVKTEYGKEAEPYEESGYYETEEVYETEPSREERSQYGPPAYPGYGGVYYAGPGYGQYGEYGGNSQPLERVERPTFSWRPSAPRALRPPATRTHGPLPGWQEPYGGTPVSRRAAAPSAPSRTVPPRVSKKQVLVKIEPGSKPVKPSSKAPTVARSSGSPPAEAPASTKPMARAKPKGGTVGATGTPRRAPRTARSPSAAPVSSIALTHAVSNAVKVLPLFHSAGVTVEKARDFWEAFEDTTRGLPDRSRLQVSRQKIKGSEAERWWNHSSIKTFETLKIRFDNHFLSRTADELRERLHSTKRARGESIEEWGDRVSDLCDSLDYPDPRMRYQLFRRGRNNRQEGEGRAAPSSGPKNGSEGDRGHVAVEKCADVTVPREVVKRESESRTESKSVKAAKRTVLPPRETKSTKETRTVGVSRTVVAGAETKKAVGRVAVQEEVVKNEVRDEPRTEESAVTEAEAVVPEEAVNQVVVRIEPVVAENDAVHEGKAEDSAEETPAQAGTDEPSVVKSMGVSTEEEMPKGYQRLFTDEELDAMEASSPGQEGTALAGQEIGVEKEEYDKELEDRLFPLDEVELLKRVKKNAEAQKEPSIDDMATHLDLPVEGLERTKEASPDGMSSPEYWLEWFQNTLESSEEAKRANRDFNAVGPGTKQGVPGATEVMYENFGLSKRRNNADEDQQERISKAAALVTKTEVLESVGVPLSCASDAALSVSTETTDEEIDPSLVRSIARLTVYEILKDYKNGDLEAEGLEERTLNLEEAIKRPPMRDKMLLVDRELFRRRASCLVEKLALPIRYGDHLSKWTEQYYAENAPSIWDKLAFRLFSLYVNRAEAVRGMEMNVVDDDDVSHYVSVVGPLRHRPERKEKRGLVKVVTVSQPNGFGMRTDDDEESDFPEVVKGGRRVVCALGSFEALSGGMIDCLPSKMLADTGATLSLVDTKVLKRLGRASEPLKPCDGLARRSSGHRLRIRGWMVLPIRLGSLEITMSSLVADQLHCDAILGVNALGAFGAVIDVAERTMTLKSTQEVLALGVTVVQETYMTAMAVSVRLPPRGQDLVMTNVIGEAADDATVLVEGSLGLPPTLCVARTLCTDQKGQVIGEVCNASTDEYWIKKGTVVASTAVIPESAFASPPRPDARSPENGKQSAGNTEGEPEAVRSLSGEQKALFQDELNAFSDLSVEPSKQPGRTDLLKFEIDMGDNRPIKQQPYRVSVAEGEVIEVEVEEYLDLGLIRPSNSPWASPVLMIRKPDGGIRFCIDYRRLNAVTVKDCYPMPLIDDILDVLGDARLFSTMDIASGYWNVPMHENSVAKTAFTCKYGLYECLVMPFGLCNAVPAYERLMETVLVDFKWRVCLVAFQQLKRALMKPPILVYPDMKKLFKLYVDSSRYAVGACLMQESEGRDRVVAYASKLLTGSQKNWITKQAGISDIECWGLGDAQVPLLPRQTRV